MDTCGGCVIDRLHDIVVATVQHCQFMARDQSDKGIQNFISLSSTHLLLLACLIVFSNFMHFGEIFNFNYEISRCKNIKLIL